MIPASSRRFILVSFLALSFLPVAVIAVPAQTTTAELERLASEIDAMLIAPCCFSQQVSVHKSPAADEAKADIRRRLATGETKQQILDAYVAKHGKHVLAEPPAEGFDIALYVTPFVLLVVSLGLLALIAKRITRQAPTLATGQTGSTEMDQRLTDELRDLD